MNKSSQEKTSCLTLPQNLLLMSVLLGYNNSMYHEGFTLPLEIIVRRDESTWTPHVDMWSDRAWEGLAVHASQSWRSVRTLSVRLSEIEETVVSSLAEIKRISSPTTLAPLSFHRHEQIGWQARWRLVCFCIDVQFTDEYSSSPFDRVDREDLIKITSLLNRSPLFQDAVSDEDISIAINQLRLLFCPPKLSVPPVSKRPSEEDIGGLRKRASQGL